MLSALMAATDRHVVPLDRTILTFLCEPVAINLASHDATLLPSIARGYGCQVSGDRKRIAVFLSCQCAQALLQDLRSGGPIAVAFSRPSTHYTLQFKAAHAEIVPVGAEERAIMRAYGAAFCREVIELGCLEPFSRGLVAPVEHDAVGIVFTPSAVFDQTPGPAAGRPVERSR